MILYASDQEKRSLRKQFLRLLKEQDQEEGLHRSRRIAQQLWELSAMERAKAVLFYASMPGEVDTLMMIEKAIFLGKRVALPIVEHNQKQLIPTVISSMHDVHKKNNGVFEPDFDPAKVLALADIDAVIVPGLAFDKAGYRLGRGAGYYDRFLSTLCAGVATIGLAFDFQLTQSLPIQAHDVRLEHIIVG